MVDLCGRSQVKTCRHKIWGSFLLLCLVLTLGACTSADSYIVPDTGKPLGADALALARKEKVEIPPLPGEPGPYRVGAGDVLLIRDLNHPDLFLGAQRTDTMGMHLFTVQDDGLLILPMVNTLEAEGKTASEIQSELNTAFRKYVREPNLSVTVSKFNSRKIYVLGQVNAPGAFPYDGRLTVLDAIGAAQGLSGRADLMGSYLARGGQVLPVDIYGLLRKGDMSQNITLDGGDVIQIADSSDRKVYVLGEVLSPGVFPMGTEPLRLIDAISMAGGLDPITAKKGNIMLVRGGYADPTVYKLDLSDVMSLTGTETILEPGDRIYATATGLTNWNRIMKQILPFLQGGESAGQIKTDFE